MLASLGDSSLAVELEPAWRAAGGWLERALRRGGGLIRHGPRRAPGGLAQQGWRDAEDPSDPAFHGAGILAAGGEVPVPPLADADTQAVTVVALRALSALSGEPRWAEKATGLADAIGEAFDPETLAIAGDGEKVVGAGSQLGWLLWADALPSGARERAADRLSRPDVLTPWGLRTLSSKHPLYAPDAYHRGAVWPFDSWLGWGGLRASGLRDTAEELRQGVLGAIRGDWAGTRALRCRPSWPQADFDRQQSAGLDRWRPLGPRTRVGWPSVARVKLRLGKRLGVGSLLIPGIHPRASFPLHISSKTG